jgi:TatA/E family protein of Tat protein translocase
LLWRGTGQYDDEMSLGFSDTGFLFFLALLLFGPKKLPEIGRQIGKVLNEFKRASNEFRSQIEAEIATLEREKEPTPQILPPSSPPQGAIASGTLIDAPDPVPNPVSHPGNDAANHSGPILENVPENLPGHMALRENVVATVPQMTSESIPGSAQGNGNAPEPAPESNSVAKAPHA